MLRRNVLQRKRVAVKYVLERCTLAGLRLAGLSWRARKRARKRRGPAGVDGEAAAEAAAVAAAAAAARCTRAYRRDRQPTALPLRHICQSASPPRARRRPSMAQPRARAGPRTRGAAGRFGLCVWRHVFASVLKEAPKRRVAGRRAGARQCAAAASFPGAQLAGRSMHACHDKNRSPFSLTALLSCSWGLASMTRQLWHEVLALGAGARSAASHSYFGPHGELVQALCGQPQRQCSTR